MIGVLRAIDAGRGGRARLSRRKRTAVHPVLVVGVLGLCAGSSMAADSSQAKRGVDPWWVVARTGGYTFQTMYGHSGGGSMFPVDGSLGGVGVGMKDGLLLGLGGGRRVNRWLAVEGALSRFDVEMGGDDLFKHTGETVPIKIGTCSVDTAQATLLFDGRTAFEPEVDEEYRSTYYVGIDLVYLRPGEVDLAEPGRSRLGVVEVRRKSTLIYGLSLRGDIALGRGPWALTLNTMLTFGGDEPFEIHTDPAAGYESTEVGFHPFTLTLGFMRRL